jgi:DNA polymerase-1
MKTPKRVLLIDGLNVFIRSFVVVPTTNADGEPSGGITGFLKSVKNLIEDVSPDRVIVVWDGEGGSRRRRGIFSEYKSGRKVRLNRSDDSETNEESSSNMSSQLKKLKNLLTLLGMIQVEAQDIEADDGLALICKHIYVDVQKIIVSSDKDMLQLIDKNTLVYSPSKKCYWNCRDMLTNLNVRPDNWIYAKALMGDSSDNIKGLGGFGLKTVVKLFPFLSEKESTLEDIRVHCELNASSSAKYKSVLDQWPKLLENIKLMQLSNPNISVSSARTIRISTLEQRPTFSFTEAKLKLMLYGLQLQDDIFTVLKCYKIRSESLYEV